MSSKKISALTATTNVAANSLMVVVDMTGPTTKKIVVSDFANNIPANVTMQFWLNVQGNTTVNAIAVTGNGVQTGNLYFSVNNIVIGKTTTPANTTDVASAAGGIGHMWSDGSYLYVRANTTHIRRVAIATW